MKLSFIRPSPNSIFNCHNPRGIRLLSRLRPDWSHLREHKFKHSFKDSLNPFYSCLKGEVETSSYYLLHCSSYSEERLVLLSTIKNIDTSILQQSDSKFTSVLLFGETSFDNTKSTFILDATIDYIISTGRFDEPLFNCSWLAFVSQELLLFNIATKFYLGLFLFIFSTRLLYSV